MILFKLTKNDNDFANLRYYMLYHTIEVTLYIVKPFLCRFVSVIIKRLIHFSFKGAII